MSTRPRVLVIGGGISGLASAHFLAKSGVDVSLVEAADRVGGTIGTDVCEGFRFERGPNGFLDNQPSTLALCRSIGLESELVEASPSAKDRFVFVDGRLQALPNHPLKFLRSPILSLRGRVRALLEPFQPAAKDGEEDSVASFGRRLIGEEATLRFLDPMVSGIYAGDIERLSLPSAFPRIAQLERDHGSLIKGMRAKRKERRAAELKSGGANPAGGSSAAADGGKAKPKGAVGGARLWSLRGGLGDLMDRLAEGLGDRLRSGTAVEAIARGENGLNVQIAGGSTESFDAVVLAVPAPRAASFCAGLGAELPGSFESISYASITVLCLGYRAEDVASDLPGYGFLVPRTEGLRTLGMIWTSTLFPDHAPGGTKSLRVMFGGARDPDAIQLSADDLCELLERELGGVLGLAGEPLVRTVYRYAQGIPQYNLGHHRRVESLEAQLGEIPGVFLCGNAYRGVALNDCVTRAEAVSVEVCESLGLTP
ncbi:MAG: protoporphyrinogen oxidase [Planctomycetota bacterium]